MNKSKEAKPHAREEAEYPVPKYMSTDLLPTTYRLSYVLGPRVLTDPRLSYVLVRSARRNRPHTCHRSQDKRSTDNRLYIDGYTPTQKRQGRGDAVTWAKVLRTQGR